MSDNYDQIADQYLKSNKKPDKLFSVLPTVLKIAGGLKTPQIILDLGSGDGFFTFPIAEKFSGSKVFGIDNSHEQIIRADENLLIFSHKNIAFIEKDFVKEELPKSDLMVIPFVLDYINDLEPFFDKIYKSLNENGSIIIVIDDPKNIDNSKFGARKKILDKNKMEIELFDEKQNYILTLNTIYHQLGVVINLLEKTGFKSIKQYKPIISEAGLKKYGSDFWLGYPENSELCYISCTK